MFVYTWNKNNNINNNLQLKVIKKRIWIKKNAFSNSDLIDTSTAAAAAVTVVVFFSLNDETTKLIRIELSLAGLGGS